MGERGEYTSTVQRVSTVDSGIEVKFENGGKLFGDFHPTIARTPENDDLRLYMLTREDE